MPIEIAASRPDLRILNRLEVESAPRFRLPAATTRSRRRRVGV